MRSASHRLTPAAFAAALSTLAVLSMGLACKKPAPAPEPVKEAPAPPPPPAPAPEPPPAPKVDDAELARKAEAERMAAMQKAAAAALRDINFDFDKSDIRDADKSKLQAIADFMRSYGKVRIRIEGHCDERGTNEYNIALGNRRAAAALAYLKALGVADERMDMVSFGKEKPKMAGHDEESWFVNRRCEFKMM